MNHLIIFTKIISSSILGFLLTKFIAKYIIKYFNELKSGQIERDYLLTHKVKHGTATIGGISFVAATIIIYTIFNYTWIFSPIMQAIMLIFIGFFLIGLIDDLIKLKTKKHNGLRGIIRLAIEIMIAIYALYLAGFSNMDLWYLEVPLLKNIIYLGSGFILLAIFIIIGSANATNLTDGLDGLATGLIMMAISPFLLISLKVDWEIALFIAVLIGSLLGFLFYNFHPAKLFMGDAGSLPLGGVIAMIAILLKLELILPIAGFILIMETLSVIIQVGWFKLTGKRLFLMAPFHHHFEKKGWPEWKVIMVFWLAGFLLCTISVAIGVI